ncbi:MAG TPA: toll/interleukin-1 receptor domain-containing protein [Candidatus Acidoferrales bacterium]|nr:toll/interleukin-1 receptor domain-containing protein [Candidatus Acidoferrales bacterium]
MAHDVFISYSSKDKTVADAVCARLEAAGIRCWIAPRDVVPGRPYGEALFEAIRGMKVMVLVFSSNANASEHIPKEVERAVSKGVPILPFRIEDVAPGKSLDYFIGSVHWLDAMNPPMEKHLDDLAATVHKLLPATEGEPGSPAAERTGIWQRSAPANVQAAPPPMPTAAPMTAQPQARPAAQAQAHSPAQWQAPAASGGAAAASSSKAIWIGVAAIVVLAVVVMGVVLMRVGKNPQSTTVVQPSSPPVNPSPIAGSNPTPSAGSNPAPAPAPAPASAPVPSSVPSSPGDPIVGCYSWTNSLPVVIHANHNVTGGGLTASWMLLNRAQRAYQITWPRSVDTITIAKDQGTLAGTNQYGVAVSAWRIAGSKGFLGTWVWKYNVPVKVPDVVVNPNGTVLSGTATGTWRAIDAARGVYALTWSDPPRDSVTLSADGSVISGANQWGLATSARRTAPCNAN